MSRRTALPAALALAGALVLGGCGSGGGDGGGRSATPAELSVEGAFVPEPVDNRMAGGFLTLRNKGGEADALVGASSDAADEVQLHRTVDNRMSEVKSLEVPADGELRLSRGGDHLMLMGLTRELEVGDRIEVELEFEDSDPLTVELPVKPRTHNPHAH